MGFLVALRALIGMELMDYLPEAGRSLLSEAQIEAENAERSRSFQKFGKFLVQEGYLIPGWKLSEFEILNDNFVNAQTEIRFTPRLMNYRLCEALD